MTISIWKPEQDVRSGGINKVDLNYPSIATLPNGGYVVGWVENNAVKFQIYNGSGETDGKIYYVDQAGAGSAQNNLTIQAIGTDGSFAVSWNVKGTTGTNVFDLKTRVFTPGENGDLTGGTIQTVASGFTTQFNEISSMEARDSGYVSAYINGSDKFDFDVYDNFGQRIGRISSVVSKAGVSNPEIGRIGSNKYVVSYYDGSDISYKIIDTTSPQSPTTTSMSGTLVKPGSKISQVVGLKDADGVLTGAFAIIWQPYNSKHLVATFFDASGSQTKAVSLRDTFNNEYGSFDVTAIKDGRIAITYIGTGSEGRSGINYSVLTIADSAGNVESKDLSGSGSRHHPRVMEMKDGRLAVSWIDSTGTNNVDMMIVDPRIAPVKVDGTARDDIYHGTDSTLGADHLKGYAGNDKLYGAGGDDVLYGGVGADRLDGGTGFNWASYFDAAKGVTANLQNSDLNNGDDEATGDTYFNIQGLEGSKFDDKLTGRDGGTALSGLDGNDTLIGGTGVDNLDGGKGDDRLYGGAGGDKLDGGEGRNTATYEFSTAGTGIVLDLLNRTNDVGESVGDTFINIQAYGGTHYADRLVGSNNYNEFFGNGGNDTLVGGQTGDYLDGGDGDDILEGGAGADILKGGAGIDYASYEHAGSGVWISLDFPGSNLGDAQGDTYESIEGLIGSAFNDNLYGKTGAGNSLWGGAGNDALEGADKNDRLYGQSGADELIGSSGDDTLEGGAGGDTLKGNAGIDVASYENSKAGVFVNLATKVGATGDAEGDTYDSIEGLLGSAFNDVLIGDASANALNGGEGNDVLIGGAGADNLVGGGGVDTVDYSASSAGVIVNLAAGIGSGGDAAGDSYSGIENAIGTSSNDTFYGNGAANVFQGGGGDDTYYVDSADAVIEAAGAGNDTVRTTGNYTLGANIENLTGDGGAALTLTGNDLNNVISGNAAGNWIDGGGGADTMRGGAGDDIYVIDNVGDVIDDNEGNNIVILKTAYNLANLPASVSISIADGINTPLTGTSGNNVLRGNAANNILKGQGGNDKLYGLAGNDRLYGGTGKDVFVFDTRLNKTKNVDKIYDFKSKDDSFFLDNAVFTKLGRGTDAGVKLKSSAFYEGTKAHDKNDRIVYDKKTGNLYYDDDGSGRHAQVKIATLTNKTKLYYHDFLVI